VIDEETQARARLDRLQKGSGVSLLKCCVFYILHGYEVIKKYFIELQNHDQN